MLPASKPLRSLASLYLKLGFTAFGGPAAHIAMMEYEVVQRRQWFTREEFLDFLGVVNLIPGPNSTEMAIQIGYRMGGIPGLLLGGVCFILPAALLTLALAWAYVRYGTMPQVAGILYGVKAVVIAIVVQAIWKLARTAVKSALLAIVGVAAMAASARGVNVLFVLFGCGVILMFSGGLVSPKNKRAALLPGTPLAGVAGAAITATLFSLWALFWFFLKIGAVLFGSGYVLLAFLRSDLVTRLHWLTDQQLLDAIAIGQVTPGPVSSTATFIGYLLGRFPGSVIATIAIFLPGFVFIFLVAPLVPRLRNSPLFGAFLDGVNVGAVALMVVVTWQLGRAALVDWTTISLAVVSLILLVRWRVNSAWLVLGGAVAGLAQQIWK